MDPFLRRVADQFQRLATGFRTSRTKNMDEVKVDVRRLDAYYGWFINRPYSRIDLDMNLTADDRAKNLARLRVVQDTAATVQEGTGLDLLVDEEGWEPHWTCGGFSIPYDGESPPLELAPRAAELMKVLVERTLPMLDGSAPRPKTEITFVVTEDHVDGGFNARAHWPDGNRDIFTEGDTREELIRNIRDAIDCSFHETETKPDLIHLHFVRDEVVVR